MKGFEKEIFSTKRRINNAVFSLTRMRYPSMKLGLAGKQEPQNKTETETDEEAEEDKHKIQDSFSTTFGDNEDPFK